MTPRTALVVDDDAAMRAVTRLSLARFGGWRVAEAASSEDALGWLAIHHADLVLLDRSLPGMRGEVLLVRLRADASFATPIVFLTGSPTATEVAALTRLGAAGVVAKPFAPDRLAAEIESILDRLVRVDGGS